MGANSKLEASKTRELITLVASKLIPLSFTTLNIPTESHLSQSPDVSVPMDYFFLGILSHKYVPQVVDNYHQRFHF